MSLFKRGNVWWYKFWFANRRVRESSKAGSKTLAKAAEQQRCRELETGFNNLEYAREDRVRTVREIAQDYLTSYRLRNPRAGYIRRICGRSRPAHCRRQDACRYQRAHDQALSGRPPS